MRAVLILIIKYYLIIEDNESTVEKLNNKHNEKLKTVSEKAYLQNDKSILELKSKHQEKVQALQRKHNAEIEEYQAKYRNLLEQNKKATTKNVKTKK